MRQELQNRTAGGFAVNAVVLIKVLILEREKYFEIALVDVLWIERQSPPAIGRRERPQQALIAVDHRRG